MQQKFLCKVQFAILPLSPFTSHKKKGRSCLRPFIIYYSSTVLIYEPESVD